MKTRPIMILSLLFLMAHHLSAQFRVEEESGKKPEWTASLQKNYIIGIGHGETLETARDKAMINVKSQIVTSVADHISSSTEIYTQEISRNEISEMYRTYSDHVSSQSGKRDYLQGISPAKVQDYFWEKLRNKKTGEIKYTYFAKYPFNTFDLEELVNEFKEKDALLTEDLKNALNMLDDFESVEDIFEARRRLQQLSGIFIDERKTQAIAGVRKSEDLLGSVYISDAGSALGKLRYSLKIASKSLTCARKPVVHSNCARIMNRELGGPVCTIDYAYDECYPDPENHISVTYSLLNHRPGKKFYFDVSEDKAEINLGGKIRITDGNVHDESVSGARCTLLLRSKYESPVKITGITLEWDEYGIIVEKTLSKIIAGQGTHALDFTIPGKLPVSKISTLSDPHKTVNGLIDYQSVKTGKKNSIRIYKRAYLTDF
ncbi:MAG: hypothetical protein R6T99_01315 [Bacteroidales bacterium]